MLHIFAQFYFIFSQCTFHVLKHCVVLWLNTQKIFWKECRLVLLLELTWGKRPQLIMLYLYPWSLIHKNQEIAKPIWYSLIWYCSFSPVLGHDLTLCHEMCFLFCDKQCQTKLLKYQSWLSVSSLSGIMKPSLQVHCTKPCKQKYLKSISCYCILFYFCLTVKWLSETNILFYFILLLLFL